MNDSPATYAFFETALGPCTLAWGEAGFCAVLLPGPHVLTTLRGHIPRCVEGEPSEEALSAMTRIRALLDGAVDDLLDLRLDMRGISPFYQRVYALTRQVPPGQTTTYGALAEALQAPGSARAIGQALGFNPFAPVVPCHRVLAARGGAGGFSAAGGLDTKLRMLEIERAVLGGTPGLFD